MRDEPLQKLNPHTDFEKLMVCEAVTKELNRQLRGLLEELQEVTSERNELKQENEILKNKGVPPDELLIKWRNQKGDMYSAACEFISQQKKGLKPSEDEFLVRMKTILQAPIKEKKKTEWQIKKERTNSVKPIYNV